MPKSSYLLGCLINKGRLKNFAGKFYAERAALTTFCLRENCHDRKKLHSPSLAVSLERPKHGVVLLPILG